MDKMSWIMRLTFPVRYNPTAWGDVLDDIEDQMGRSVLGVVGVGISVDPDAKGDFGRWLADKINEEMSK